MTDKQIASFKNALCVCCLTINRKLYCIRKENLDVLFNIEISESDKICWECKSIITKMVTFQSQAMKARSILAEAYKNLRPGKTFTIPSLSTLKQSEVQSCTIQPTIITDNKLPNQDVKEELDTNVEGLSLTSIYDREEPLPIKVEAPDPLDHLRYDDEERLPIKFETPDQPDHFESKEQEIHLQTVPKQYDVTTGIKAVSISSNSAIHSCDVQPVQTFIEIDVNNQIIENSENSSKTSALCGSDTVSEYECDAPGTSSSTNKKNLCCMGMTMYSRLNNKASTSQSIGHESQRSSTLKMSSAVDKIKRLEDEKELVGAVSSDIDKKQVDLFDDVEKKKRLQNKIRCKRYRDKRKRDVTINSQISKHQSITYEEDIKIKRRKEQNKQKSKRYRDKKRATNLVNLQTDQPLKTVAKHVPKHQDFHTSQIPGPSTRNVPTHTPRAAGPSIRNEFRIPESYSDHDTNVQNDIPSKINYVQQLDESMMVNYATNPDICDRLWFKKDLKTYEKRRTT